MTTLSDSDRWLVLVGVVGTGWVLYLLAPILTPFAVAALFAYLGDPHVDQLEKRGLGRTTAVFLVFLGLTLLLVLLLLVLVPALQEQIVKLVRRLPEMISWAQGHLQRLQQLLAIDLLDPEQLVQVVREHGARVGGVAADLLGSLSRSGMAVVAWLLNLFLIPVVTFYLMRDWDVLIQRIRELLPRAAEPTAVRLARDADAVLGAFLRGQLAVMAALALVYSVGLWLVGVDLALLIGSVAGVISFVPYLGTIVGVGAGVLAALFQFQDVVHVLLVLGVFGLGQLLEGMVLTPWLVGDRIGLHPVAVIFAVLAGGQLFGFLGILIALPAAAVIMVLLRYAHERYVASRFYGEGGPGRPASEGGSGAPAAAHDSGADEGRGDPGAATP